MKKYASPLFAEYNSVFILPQLDLLMAPLLFTRYFAIRLMPNDRHMSESLLLFWQ